MVYIYIYVDLMHDYKEHHACIYLYIYSGMKNLIYHFPTCYAYSVNLMLNIGALYTLFWRQKLFKNMMLTKTHDEI